MSAHFTTPTDELLLLAETLGEVKTKADKLEAEFATQARPLEAATNALSAALSGIKALQFHVLDNNLGALSARVEEMRKAVDEQVGVIALELKKADETNAAKAGQEAEALRSEIAALQAQLGTLGAQFSAQLERVEFSAKEEAKKLQLIPGPAGAAGASLNPRGTFIDGETYNRLDVVSWLGSSYIAAVDGVTEKPSRNSNQWQVLASRGGGAAGGAGDFGSLAGVAQINQGGTGQTTRAAGLNALLPDQTGATQYMLLTDGAGNVSWGAQPVAGLPSQTSNSGKLLTTNGTSASWSNAVTVSGSNATVTGTLTVNGTGASSFGGRLAVGSAALSDRMFYVSGNTGTTGASQFSAVVNPTIPNTVTTGAYGLYLGTNIAAGATVTNSYSLYVASPDYTGSTITNKYGLYSADTNPSYFAGKVSIADSSISTTTSSGALVVSGGVGIAKQIVAGEDITIDPIDASPENLAPEVAFCRSASLATATSVLAFGSSSRIGLLRGYHDGADQVEWRFGSYIGTTFNEQMRLGGTSATSSSLTLYGTTASTSTSSGALVVSGGVGVAKGLYVGEEITAANGTSTAPSIRFSSATTSGFSRVNTNSIGIVNNGIASGYLDGISGSGGLYIAASGTNQGITLAANGTGTVVISGAFQVGNAYVAGAPTATGYIVIKDSTGTSYKIPAQAL